MPPPLLQAASFRVPMSPAYAPPFWSLICFIYSFIFPCLPIGQPVGREQSPCSALTSHCFLTFWNFCLPINHHSLYLFLFPLLQNSFLHRDTSNLAPCLFYIASIFFLLQLSPGESPDVIQACRCGSLQPMCPHSDTHTNTEAPVYYSSCLCRAVAEILTSPHHIIL